MGKRRSGVLFVHRNDERFVHAEDRVRFDVGVSRDIKRGNHLAVSGCANHEMNVSGTEAVAFLGANHIADRAIHGNHIAERAEAPEVVAAVGVGMEASAQVHLRGVVQL